MRKIWLGIAAAVVVVGLGLTIVGCSSSTHPGSDKMSTNKMSNDKMSNDKMSNDKMSGDKMSGDKKDKM